MVRLLLKSDLKHKVWVSLSMVATMVNISPLHVKAGWRKTACTQPASDRVGREAEREVAVRNSTAFHVEQRRRRKLTVR